MWCWLPARVTKPARSSATRCFPSRITTCSRPRSDRLDLMTEDLWTFDDLVRAAGGVADGRPLSSVTGFSIDTRTLKDGDVFVALKDQRDGHEFVTTAFRSEERRVGKEC